MTSSLATLLCLLAGGVHLALAPHHLQDDLLLGTGFVLAAAALIGAACRLGLRPDRLSWAAAAASCGGVAGAYVLSRTTTALPHSHGWDVVGLATTGAELAVVAMAVAAARGRHRCPAAAMPVARVATAALLAVATAAFGLPQLATADEMQTQPDGCVSPSRTIRLYAYELPRPDKDTIRLGWGTRPDDPSSASIPGPLLELVEGECLAVTVTNNVPEATLLELRTQSGGAATMPLGVSLHVHGVKYRALSDGTAHTGSWVAPGETRTYIWYAAPRIVTAGRVTSMGSAGYWWYHDHVAGTTHGTGGQKAGLIGAVVVRRPGDLAPDVSYTAAFGPRRAVLCGRTTITAAGRVVTADRPCLSARQGERVEIAAFGVGDEFHTFHLHGHNWAANRTGILTSLEDATPLIDARTLGPSESFGFQVVAGESVGPGQWMLHCHVQEHSDDGMVAFLDVGPGGSPTAPLDAGAHDATAHDH